MIRPSILVTRPEPEATATADDLARRGFEPLLAPMLTTVFGSAAPPVACDGLAGVVATSANGVRGLARRAEFPLLAHLPIYVVGDATGQAARDHGFANIRSAHGTARDLIALIGTERDRLAAIGERPRLLQAAGRDKAADLGQDLAPAGVDIIEIEVYRAEAADRLPGPVADRLAAGTVDGILIFSARTAEAFVTAAENSGSLGLSRRIAIHAISPRSAEPLMAAGFEAITIAARPDQAALIDSLRSLSARNSAKR